MEITLTAARGELQAWRNLRDRLEQSRDETVIRALKSGVTTSEISRITGLSRTTVDRIAASDD